MGATLSTKSVVVEVTPEFYDTDGNVTHVTKSMYKKRYTLSEDDIQYLFGPQAKIVKQSIVDGTLKYEVITTKSLSYIKEAWKLYTGAGDPVVAKFIKQKRKNKIYFRVQSIKFSKKTLNA